MRPGPVAPSVDQGGSPPLWTSFAMGFGLLVFGLQVIGYSRAIDLDLFHEMALIREALALGRIPLEDPFGYTSTVSPMVHHEWGTGAVIYFFVVGLGLGANGLVLLRFLLLAGLVACCIVVARSRGAGWREMTLMAPLAIFMFSPGLAPVRAHMFTFLFLAVLLLLLERERLGDRRWLLLWPPLFVLWLNLHGGFVVGAGLLGLYTAERFVRAGMAARGGASGWGAGWREAFRRTRHLFLTVGVSLPLLLVNPYGLDYVTYLWHALTMDRPYMTEWFPLWATAFHGAPLVPFAASLLVAGYTLWRGESWKRLPGGLVLLATAVFALQSARILPIYAVAWFSYVAPALSATPLAPIVRRAWHRYARPVAALTLALATLGFARTIQRQTLSVFLPTEQGDHRQLYPAGAVRYLEEVGFEGNLMTPFGVGAYVSWELYPAVKVGMDSRYEVAYTPALAEETIRVYRGVGDWREFLGRHPTDAVLVPAGGALDARIRGASPDDAAPADGASWVEVFRDDAYAIFARPDVARRMPRVDRTGRRIIGTFP